MTATLFPAQQKIVTQLMARDVPRRAIISADTGCGKTVMACSFIRRSGAQSVLIVCPAIVREHWARHIAEWTDLSCGTLTESALAALNTGRTCQLRHHAAAHRDVVVTSFDLVWDAPEMPYDLIIIDELHHVGNPKSKQSKEVAKLFNRYPNADIIGLSATLIPTEVKQLWNPLRLFEGDVKWGRATKTGGISWRFQERYCEKEKSEYGTSYFGVREDAVGPLRASLSTVCYPLSRADVLPDMPPLDLHVITGDLKELIAERLEVVNKLVVLVHHRALVHELVGMFCGTNHATFSITGLSVPEDRIVILNNADTYAPSLVIATHDSLLEGIRILWPDQVLIAEFNGSPGKLMQLLGRFASVGSNARPQVNLVANDESYSAAQAIAQRAPGMIGLGLATTGLDEVAAKIEEGSNQQIDWTSMLSNMTTDDWSDE